MSSNVSIQMISPVKGKVKIEGLPDDVMMFPFK
jgi:hypothetical protein